MITKPERKYVPKDLTINSWDSLASIFKELLNRPINSVSELEKWMLDNSELSAVLEEDMAWRYIRMNVNTKDKHLQNEFNFWIREIAPKIAPFAHKFNLKLINSPFKDQLDYNTYNVYLRGVKNQIDIFRDENILLLTQIQEKQQYFH